MPPAPPTVGILDIATLAAGLTAWSWIAARLWRRQPLLPMEPRRQVPWGGVDILVVVGAFILLNDGCAEIGLSWAGLPQPKNISDADAPTRFVLQLSYVASRLLLLLFAVVWLMQRAGATAADLGFDWRHAPQDIWRGAVAFVAIAPVILGVQYLLTEVLKFKYSHELIKTIEQQRTAKVMILSSVSAIVIAPLIEEFLFRVLLQGWLEKVEFVLLRRRSAPGPNASSSGTAEFEATSPIPLQGLFGLPLGLVPITISSMLFALIHLGQGPAPIPLFLLALVLGYLYQRTHRLGPSLVVHLLLNGVSMFVLLTSAQPAPGGG